MVCAHSSSSLFHNLQLRHLKPRCDLGVHELPSADDLSFQQPLPTILPWDAVGNSLGAHGGFYQGFARKRDSRRDAPQAKGKLGTGRTGFVAEGMVRDAYTTTGL